MAQQPNVEILPEERPADNLDTAPARRQISVRPGTITEPGQQPFGGLFGTPGPDAGWALRILNSADLPDQDPRLTQVLAALMSARAAHYGRAPTLEDLEVALALAGMGRVQSEALDEKRARWMVGVSHERAPGRGAVAEVGEILYETPEHIDVLVRR